MPRTTVPRALRKITSSGSRTVCTAPLCCARFRARIGALDHCRKLGGTCHCAPPQHQVASTGSATRCLTSLLSRWRRVTLNTCVDALMAIAHSLLSRRLSKCLINSHSAIHFGSMQVAFAGGGAHLSHGLNSTATSQLAAQKVLVVFGGL